MKKAKTIQLFDKDGNELIDYKAVVNEENQTEIFQVVTNGYTIVQHNEVIEVINKSLEDKNLTPKRTTKEMNNGGRIREEMIFRDITLDIEDNGVKIPLQISQDNSYDGTTGLRLEVGALSKNNGFLWVNDISTYYHRHTKGINVAQFEKNLDKAISDFQTKIKDHFMRMFKTSITQEQAINFIEEALEDKKYKGSYKYLELILTQLKLAIITNKWQVYTLICEVISKNSTSVDNRNNQMAHVIRRLHKKFPNTKINTSTSTVENKDSNVLEMRVN